MYYFGVPSGPTLIARTSTSEWQEPLGPDTRPKKKQLKNIGEHRLVDLWDEIAPKDCQHLGLEFCEICLF
jgi:hypothetical protein